MGSGLFDEELRNMLMNRAQGPAIVHFVNGPKGAALPSDADLHPAPMFPLTLDVRDLPPGMDVYKDTNGRLAVKWARDTNGRFRTFAELGATPEEQMRAGGEQTTTNTTDLATSNYVYCVRVVLTSDANGDILAGDITKATAGVGAQLLRFHSAATLGPTSGVAAPVIVSDDTTPVVFAKGTLAETWQGSNGVNLYGNAACSAGKKWTLTCGALDANTAYTFYAWIRVA